MNTLVLLLPLSQTLHHRTVRIFHSNSDEYFHAVHTQPDFPRPDAALGWHQIKVQRLGLAVPEDHWAANRREVRLAEFAADPFIGMLPGYGTRMLLDALADDAGFSPHLVFESMELTTVAGLVAAGLGVAKIAFLTVAGGAAAGWFSHVNWPVLALAVVIWGAYIKFRWHPIIYIALSAVAGIVFSL